MQDNSAVMGWYASKAIGIIRANLAAVATSRCRRHRLSCGRSVLQHRQGQAKTIRGIAK